MITKKIIAISFKMKDLSTLSEIIADGLWPKSNANNEHISCNTKSCYIKMFCKNSYKKMKQKYNINSMAKTYNELVLILMIAYGTPNFLLRIGLTCRQTNEPLDSILNINRL